MAVHFVRLAGLVDVHRHLGVALVGKLHVGVLVRVLCDRLGDAHHLPAFGAQALLARVIRVAGHSVVQSLVAAVQGPHFRLGHRFPPAAGPSAPRVPCAHRTRRRRVAQGRCPGLAVPEAPYWSPTPRWTVQTHGGAMVEQVLVLYEVREHVAHVTLNRPEKLNALSRELLAELVAAFERARTDDGVRAVVLGGAGRAFSSGADLGGPRAGLGRSLDEWWTRLEDGLTRQMAVRDF